MTGSQAFLHSISVMKIDLDNPRQIQAFLDLPFGLYRDRPNWIQPLQFEGKKRVVSHQEPFLPAFTGSLLPGCRRCPQHIVSLGDPRASSLQPIRLIENSLVRSD